MVDVAIREQRHQAFLFHKIGNPTLYERLKALYHGYESTFSEEQFLVFLDYLVRLRDRLWITTVLNIEKYQHERNNSRLEFIDGSGNSYQYRLVVGTGRLYDHELTLNLNNRPAGKVTIYQNESIINGHTIINEKLSFNVKPESSTIRIIYGGKA